jgi:hypothetical protein
MNRVLILFALALSAFTAGCQTATKSPSAFPCTWRTAESGYCEQPGGSFNLFGRILER